MNSSTLPPSSAQATWKRVGAALRAVAQEVLDEPEADVAGLALVDGVELDDRPLVAVAVALHAQQPGQVAVLLVDVQLVVRLEGAERHAEEAEDADRAARDRQARATGPMPLVRRLAL